MTPAHHSAVGSSPRTAGLLFAAVVVATSFLGCVSADDRELLRRGSPERPECGTEENHSCGTNDEDAPQHCSRCDNVDYERQFCTAECNRDADCLEGEVCTRITDDLDLCLPPGYIEACNRAG